jgi:two-component system, NarL family, response regulator DevR
VSVKTVRVFIAEDSPHVLNALGNILLEIEGMELIGHASDAATAAAQIRRTRPDVAILDIRLASGSGVDVLRSIRHGAPEDESSAAPVTIVFTSHIEPRLRQVCLKLGADYIFNKADDAERLAGVLTSLVKLRSTAQARDEGEIS